MKKQFLVLAAIATAAITTTIVASSCKRNLDSGFAPRSTHAGPNPLGLPEKKIPNIIRQDLFLANDTCWILDGKVYVDDGAILTIQSGARVEAEAHGTGDSTAYASALIVTRGSQIFADGQECESIVFTSHEANPKSGDWGGIVLLGDAPLNRADTTIEGIDLPTLPVGIDVNYGGGGRNQGDTLDNSGILRYVRIEYAGAVIEEGNELNGLTCGGVGKNTTLDFIEVAWGNDDAFEFFGGNVNAYHLIAYVPDDDAFDFDFGYRGRVQFGVSVLNDTENYSSNPNGIESDNNATGALDELRTRPLVSNLTVIGVESGSVASAKGLLNGAHFRRASSIAVRNSIFIGFPTGVLLQSVPTQNDSVGVDPVGFKYNLVQAFGTPANPVFGGGNTWYTGGSANANTLINNPFSTTAPDFRLGSGSPALTGANFGGFPTGGTAAGEFDAVSYRGAFDGSTDWTACWAKFDYSNGQ